MEERPIDAEQYGELLAATRPGIIETPEEHERLLGIAEGLMEKESSLSAEEEKLLALLVLLIGAYDETLARAEDEEEEDEAGGSHLVPLPHETLDRLLKARGLELSDVSDIFGNPHRARDVLQGKRPISRGEAKQLGRFFQVPPKLFHQ